MSVPSNSGSPGGLIAPEGTMRYIDSPEGPIGYFEKGEGRPLMLVPAFGPQPGTTGWLVYRNAVERLSAYYRCIVIEASNFGITGPVVFHEPGHDVTVRAVIRVLDHLGLEAVDLVGSSMGATVCIDLALQHPERARSLVIGSCHASTGGDPYLLSPFPSEVWRLYLESQADASDRAALERLLRGMWFDPDLVTPELVDEILAFRVLHSDHMDAVMASRSIDHSNVADLHRIDIPTLIVHGRADRMVPIEQALMISAHITHADVLLLNRCGHWPSMERPDAFADAVHQFLSSTERAAMEVFA